MPGPLRRLPRSIVAHPVAAVFAIALAVRTVFAVISYLVDGRDLIPDEHLYIDLARNVVHGVEPDAWYPGYGQFLYDSVRAFAAPLVLLFHVFGPYRIVGQLLAALAGAATAAVTVALGRRFLQPPFAMGAGLVVALLPSQIVFSGVVLRESEVWLALTLVAYGALLMMGSDWRRLVGGAALAALALATLGYLRDQTLLAAAWALAPALLLARRELWAQRAVAGVAIALLVPWAVGLGPGGVRTVRASDDTLAKTRATLAIGARSAFPSTATAPGAASPGRSASPVSPGTQAAIAANTGEQSVRRGLGHLPVGLVDVGLRPFPWQSSSGTMLSVARAETLLWYLLYLLAAVGIVGALRRTQARLALQFPVLLTGMYLGIAALTQGNLGTAFRHREQALWALALAAAAGAEWLSSGRTERRVTASPAAEETREPVPMLSGAHNSLSSEGR